MRRVLAGILVLATAGMAFATDTYKMRHNPQTGRGDWVLDANASGYAVGNATAWNAKADYNFASNNFNGTGNITTTGNITAGNFTTTGNITATNIYGDGFNTLIPTSTVVSFYPVEKSGTYVKATSYYTADYKPEFTTDTTTSLIGTWAQTQWVSNLSPTNQSFQIDIGEPQIVNQIYYENAHNSGATTTAGIKTFILYGSNDAADFSNTDYANAGNWVALTTSQNTFDQHSATNAPDHKTITVTNTIPYRYYAFKVSDNWGFASFMGVRRLVLQSVNASGQFYRGVTNTVSSLIPGRIPFVGNNNTLVDSPIFSFGNDGAVYSIHTNPMQPRGFVSEDVGDFSNAGSYMARHARGSVASKTAVLSGDSVGAYCGSGYDGVKYQEHTGILQFMAAENFTTSNYGTNLRIQLIKKNVGYGFSDVALFSSEGDLGIGTTSPLVRLSLAKDSANTATIQEMLRIATTSTGTVAANFGASIDTYLEDGNGSIAQQASSIGTIWTTPTHGAESSAITFSGVTSGGAITEWGRFVGGKFAIGGTKPIATLDVKGIPLTTYGAPQISVTGRGSNKYSTIGFGYTSGTTKQPAEIGYQETISSSNTYGDLVFATRSVTTDTVPSERMRITGGGNTLIGSTDNDGTPATGRLVVKGSTNDGTTNIMVGRDSDEVNAMWINTNGSMKWGSTSLKKLTLRPSMVEKSSKAGGTPTQVYRGLNVGYSLPIWSNPANLDEELYFRMRIPRRWDGTTDPQLAVMATISGVEDVGDKFKFQLEWQTTPCGGTTVMGTTTSNVVSEQTIITGGGAAYTAYCVIFTFNADDVTNPIIAGEMLQARLRRISASSSEVTGEIMVWDWASMWPVDKVYDEWSVETNAS